MLKQIRGDLGRTEGAELSQDRQPVPYPSPRPPPVALWWKLC